MDDDDFIWSHGRQTFVLRAPRPRPPEPPRLRLDYDPRAPRHTAVPHEGSLRGGLVPLEGARPPGGWSPEILYDYERKDLDFLGNRPSPQHRLLTQIAWSGQTDYTWSSSSTIVEVQALCMNRCGQLVGVSSTRPAKRAKVCLPRGTAYSCHAGTLKAMIQMFVEQANGMPTWSFCVDITSREWRNFDEVRGHVVTVTYAIVGISDLDQVSFLRQREDNDYFARWVHRAKLIDPHTCDEHESNRELFARLELDRWSERLSKV